MTATVETVTEQLDIAGAIKSENELHFQKNLSLSETSEIKGKTIIKY